MLIFILNNICHSQKLISREEQVRKCTICKGQKALISDPLGQSGTLGQHISALDSKWICYFINSAVNALGGEAHAVGKVLTESWGPGGGTGGSTIPNIRERLLKVFSSDHTRGEKPQGALNLTPCPNLVYRFVT